MVQHNVQVEYHLSEEDRILMKSFMDSVQTLKIMLSGESTSFSEEYPKEVLTLFERILRKTRHETDRP